MPENVLSSLLERRNLANEITAAVSANRHPPTVLVAVDERERIPGIAREATATISKNGLPVVPANSVHTGEPTAAVIAIKRGASQVRAATTAMRTARKNGRMIVIVYPIQLSQAENSWRQLDPDCQRVRIAQSPKR